MSLHPDQLPLDLATATRLIRRAVPGDQPVRFLLGAGTTSYVLRIGEELLARFPMTGGDPAAVEEALAAEHEAMDELAQVSTVPVPMPIEIGQGDDAYPLPFSVQTWVPGEVATPASVAGSREMAVDLAGFIGALRAAPRDGRTFSGRGRGGDLRGQDPWMRECFHRSAGLLPVDDLRDLWGRLRALPREGSDAMCHGDLIPANVLVADDRLTGVLDTGGFAPADPALDLVAGWHLLDAPARAILEDALGAPELERLRGAAWAFAQAMGLVWYYEQSNPDMAELGRSTLARLLAAPELAP